MRLGVRRWALFAPALALAFASSSAAEEQESVVRRNVVKACVRDHDGDARIVSPSEECRRNEKAVSWNIEGPIGPQGGPGPKGDPGATGLQGRDGLNGINGLDGKDGRDGRDGQDCSGGGGGNAPSVIGTINVDGVHKPDEASEILAFSGGLSNSGTLGGSTGGGAGKANFQDISVSKYVDSSSPKLYMLGAEGTHIKTVTIVVFRKGTKDPELTYTLEESLVSSISQGAGGASEPMANVTFNFGRIKIKFTPESGTETDFCFDVQQNRSCS
jgi:type VI secretion system secreted protein Hcp